IWMNYGPCGVTLVPKRDNSQLDRRRFGGGHDLTLGNELGRRQVAERAVWPALIVVDPPRFDLGLCVGDRRELVHVQTFVAEPPVKRFDERVFDGFARADEVQLYA